MIWSWRRLSRAAGGERGAGGEGGGRREERSGAVAALLGERAVGSTAARRRRRAWRRRRRRRERRRRQRQASGAPTAARGLHRSLLSQVGDPQSSNTEVLLRAPRPVGFNLLWQCLLLSSLATGAFPDCLRHRGRHGARMARAAAPAPLPRLC